MNHLAIDIETYSPVNLKSEGVYKYTASADFEILLFAYSLNAGPVQVIDLTDGRGIPDEIMKFLTADNCIKTAWNAAFEICCINKFFKIQMPKNQWQCTMVKASMLSLPMALGQASMAMNLGVQKDKGGAALIKYFCIPCKPTKVNKGRLRNLPEHDANKWLEFLRYVKRDVETERAIGDTIAWFKIPEHEQRLWELDQEINDRGILMDHDMIESAMQVDNDFRLRTMKEAIGLTGLRNPNSVSQLMIWLKSEMDLEESSKLRKEDIPILKVVAWEYTNYENINRVLEIRQELSKTSVKKYQAMVNVRGEDGRARGLFQFYGANRTGRWAGRLLQFHNLPKTTMDEYKGLKNQLDLARRTACKGDSQIFDILDFYDEDGNTMTVPEILSQLIRTAFIPEEAHKFVVVDSSAIEARIIAWLSGEKWRLDVFATHGKIYEASAARMFGIEFDKVTKDDRARGKVAELALGYQGGPNAMIRMDTKKKVEALASFKFNHMDWGPLRAEWDAKCKAAKKPLLTDDELEEEFVFSEYKAIVEAWRPANPAIKELWEELNQAALEVVDSGGLRKVSFVKLYMKKGALFIELPSGRSLVYLRPQIRTKIVRPKKGDPFEVTGVAYLGVDQVKKTWGYEHTYGGKLTENICQAIARDCLGYWIAQVSERFNIVAHVHDEIVIEAPDWGNRPEQILEDAISLMSKEIPWAPGLPLAAAGFVTDYYKKD